MNDWEEASQSVITIAEQLIEEYHPHLEKARIGFVFRKKAQKSGGVRVLGQTQKINPKLQVCLELDFLIWISKEDWEEKFTDAQQHALVDHELSHCGFDVDNGWVMRPHDVQEFWHIIKRHGLWSADLMRGKEALEKAVQKALPMLDGNPPGKVVSVEVKSFGILPKGSE